VSNDSELTDFDRQLIAAAKIRRDKMIAENQQCCGTCKFGAPPNNPTHAAHYVECKWSNHNAIPCHVSTASLERMMPSMSGQACATYHWNNQTDATKNGF